MNQQNVLVFPGQGSQFVGMGQEFAAIPQCAAVFEQADEVLGQHLSKLMFTGDAAELTLTANTQPALLTVSYAAWVYLQSQSGKQLPSLAQLVAGHSLGEYSAMVAAEVFSFADGLKLVRARGNAMQAAVSGGDGAMAAILGLEFHQVEQIVAANGCFVANDNSEGQVVISGIKAAVEAANAAATAAGAKRALMLPVSAPFHCPLMQPAANVMAEKLAEIEFNQPTVPIITNVTATAQTAPQTLRDGLVAQVAGGVRWRESMIFAAKNGITQTVEIGAGKVLTGLAKRCDARLTGSALGTPQQIDDWLELNI